MGLTTPINMDIYSRTQALLFDENEIIRAPFGGQAFFGGRMGSTKFEPDASVFEYDISRATTKLAPMIIRGTNAAHQDSTAGMKQELWTNFARLYPLIEDKGSVTADQIINKVKGESTYGSGLTKQDRTLILANSLHKKAIQKSFMTMEYLAWQSILTGTQPILIGATDTNLLYDWERKATHAVAGTSWTNSSTDILSDIDDGWDLINVDAHAEADILLCGDTGMESIVSNDDILAISDNRRQFNNKFEVPLMEQAYQFLTAEGFGYRGELTTKTGNKFQLFTYKKFYTNSSDVTTRYLPINKVVMTSSSAIGNRHFGPSDEMEPTQQQRADYRDLMGIDMGSMPSGLKMNTSQRFDPRWFTFGLQRNRKNFEFFTQIAPVYVPVTTDAWVVYTVT